MNDRWAINIDVEGFSKNYEYSEERKTFAICALGELMGSIVKIGTMYYPGDPDKNFSDRLFAHQFGDGFLICSDFPEEDATRPICIAVAIMRHMMMKGYATKVAISTGDMSDIKGCYPKSVRDAKEQRVNLGMGLMTIIPVMGTALTKAHKLAGTQKGAVLIVDQELLALGLPEGVQMTDHEVPCIDWVSNNLTLANDIANLSDLQYGDVADLMSSFIKYTIQKPTPPPAWIDATLDTLVPEWRDNDEFDNE